MGGHPSQTIVKDDGNVVTVQFELANTTELKRWVLSFGRRAQVLSPKALPYPEGARGMLAAVSGRFVAMDALDRPEMFKCVWNRLVSGYAVDAIGRAEADAKPFGEKSARFILDSLSECRVSAFKAVGLGQELRFESDVMLGQALAVDDVVVHISVFPNDPDSQRRQDEHGHIMPPSFRRQARRPHSEE